MPHSDATAVLQSWNDHQTHVRAAFVAHLKPSAHLLNGQCAAGEDLRWLRAEGYVVTACDEVLADAKIASQQSGQAVRVSPLTQMRSVLPYDGIWLSRPLAGETATLIPLLQQLTTLLKPGAPLCFPLQARCDMTHAQQTHQLQALITAAGLPLRWTPTGSVSASTPAYACHVILWLCGDHPPR